MPISRFPISGSSTPMPKTLEAFELRKGDWVLIASHANEDEIAIAPFAEVSFSLGSLWNY